VTCHADVRRHGAPSFFRLDEYEDRSDGTLGAASVAACLCANVVQATEGARLRMPFQPLRRPICDSDRETLRNWVNQGAPERMPAVAAPGFCEPATACVRATVPANPTYDEVRPIIAARCMGCHGAERWPCFARRWQGHFRLDAEGDERVTDGGVVRGVGLFEYRGEVVRAAVDRQPLGLNLIPPMPYQPPHGGSPVDLVPRLCDNDRETLRRWAEQGRRTGSRAALGPECVTEAVPQRPTWQRDVRRILAGRCGLCHGEKNRAGLEPPLRLDLYARTRPGGAPGVTDERCVETLDPGATQIGLVRLERLPVQPGPCTPGGRGAKHLRMRVLEFVKSVSMDEKSMPLGADRDPPVRAPLCDEDKSTILLWREIGAPFE
jgi:hypothetical protein